MVVFLVVGSTWLWLHRPDPGARSINVSDPSAPTQAVGATIGMLIALVALIAYLYRHPVARAALLRTGVGAVFALMAALLIGGKIGSLFG
jgi:hypothetical protein